MGSIRRLATTTLLSLILVAVVAGAADASDGPPPHPLQNLQAAFQVECVDDHTPAVRWSVWNHTNGPHIFELRHNGNKVLSTVVAPGASKTSKVSSPLWQGTTQTFQILALGKVRGHLHQHLDCSPADLSVLVDGGPVNPVCPGSVMLEVINSGGTTAHVTVAVDGTVVSNMNIWPQELIPAYVTASAGQLITVDHDGVAVASIGVVSCSPDAPEPPVWGDDAGGPSLNDDPADLPPATTPTTVTVGELAGSVPTQGNVAPGGEALSVDSNGDDVLDSRVESPSGSSLRDGEARFRWLEVQSAHERAQRNQEPGERS